MTKPTIHMNGTSPRELLAKLVAARNAIMDAQNALGECSPNGRDYYPQGPEALKTAMAEHDARARALNAIAEDLLALALHIQDTCPKTGPLALD